MSIVRRIARPLLASVFIVQGVDTLRRPEPRADKAAPLLAKVPADSSVPSDPVTVVRLNGAALVAGGALLATGRMPRLAASVLALGIIPDTALAYPFWSQADPSVKAEQRSHFMKNLGLLGGALLAAVDTEGRPGLAWRAQNAATVTKREARHAAASARREIKAAKAEAKLKAKNAVS